MATCLHKNVFPNHLFTLRLTYLSFILADSKLSPSCNQSISDHTSSMQSTNPHLLMLKPLPRSSLHFSFVLLLFCLLSPIHPSTYPSHSTQSRTYQNSLVQPFVATSCCLSQEHVQFPFCSKPLLMSCLAQRAPNQTCNTFARSSTLTVPTVENLCCFLVPSEVHLEEIQHVML